MTAIGLSIVAAICVIVTHHIRPKHPNVAMWIPNWRVPRLPNFALPANSCPGPLSVSLLSCLKSTTLSLWLPVL